MPDGKILSTPIFTSRNKSLGENEDAFDTKVSIMNTNDEAYSSGGCPCVTLFPRLS